MAKCPKCNKGFIYLNEETVKIGPQQHLARIMREGWRM
jgi:hypothetical protein